MPQVTKWPPDDWPDRNQEAPRPMNVSDEIRRALVQRKVDAEVEYRLGIIDSYGGDREDGTVLKFDKTLPVRGSTFTSGQVITAENFNALVQQAQEAAENPTRTYTYVAIRAGGRWYLSGPTQSGCGKAWDWDELTIWLAADGEPVTELVELVEAALLAPPRVLTREMLRPDPGWTRRIPGEFDEEDKIVTVTREDLAGGTGERGNSSGNGANDRPRKRRLITTGTLGGVPRNWQLG